MMHLNGTPIVTSIYLIVPYEDWSRVRSPSRARRRLRYGHKQNIRHTYVPDPNVYQAGGTLHMHPVTMLKLTENMRSVA